MKLWTVQPIGIYDAIIRTGAYRCDPEQSELVRDYGFGPAYRWMARQMKERIGPPPDSSPAGLRTAEDSSPAGLCPAEDLSPAGLCPAEGGVSFPVWAWHTVRGEHRRPDMRWAEFRAYRRPFALIEADIPDRDVLLSDEELWHFVLNGWYLSSPEDGTECGDEQEWLSLLTEDARKAAMEKSWERIFDIPAQDGAQDGKGRYIQATFWELRKDEITNIWLYR